MLAFSLWIVWSGIKQANAKFAAGTFHPVAAELSSVIHVQAVGSPVLDKSFAETVLHN